MVKKIMIVIVILLGAGVFLLNDLNFNQPSSSQPPRVLEERTSPLPQEKSSAESISPSIPSSTDSNILDFQEVHRFNFVEEIGKIRFTMTVGRVYKMGKHNEYSYHGIKTQYSHTGGAVHVTDTSDPEFTIVHRYLFMVGQGFSIWFLPVGEGRYYMVTVLEVGPLVLKLRIEDIMN